MYLSSTDIQHRHLALRVRPPIQETAMYLSPSDIQQTRLHTIDNLHLASRAWVDATEKLAELTMRAGRQAFERGHSRMAALAETREFSFDSLTRWHDNDWHADSASLVSEYFGIIGDAHQAVLHLAKKQVAVLDTVLLRQMDRAALSADANGEVAIDNMKTAIRQAENGFNELADAAESLRPGLNPRQESHDHPRLPLPGPLRLARRGRTRRRLNAHRPPAGPPLGARLPARSGE